MVHFITPLYRYNNVKIIYSSIVHQINEFRWHLIEGDNRIGDESLDFLEKDDRVIHYKIKTYHPWGHEQRNYFITDILGNSEDWCYFLDDDNIVTGDFVSEVLNYENQNYDVILFAQKKGLTEIKRLHALEGHMSLNNCDIGSFAIKYSIIKKTIIPHIHERCADGYYCEQISRMDEIKIKYLDNKFVRYNSLSLQIH